MKYDVIIAIDPDVDMSGVAILETNIKKVEVERLSFPALVERIKRLRDSVLLKEHNTKMVVVVEAGWMNATNWHLPQRCTARMAADIGKRTGRNHETGRKLCEMFRHMGIEVVEHIPLRKGWKGRDGKITQEEITQFVPGLPKRMNQDERDATLLAWCFANFPIRLKC